MRKRPNDPKHKIYWSNCWNRSMVLRSIHDLSYQFIDQLQMMVFRGLDLQTNRQYVGWSVPSPVSPLINFLDQVLMVSNYRGQWYVDWSMIHHISMSINLRDQVMRVSTDKVIENPWTDPWSISSQLPFERYGNLLVWSILWYGVLHYLPLGKIHLPMKSKLVGQGGKSCKPCH